jgi:hypothetical protein
MSSLSIQGFEKMILKSVKVIEKEGKKPLVFVKFVDFNTFDDTDDFIFIQENLTFDTIASLKALEKKPVKAVLSNNEFNGRKSFVCVDIKPA